jgi:DNA-binding PadR family transcriptional regulator
VGAAHSGALLMKTIGLSSGTLYPILMRFEDAGVLDSEWEKGKAHEMVRPRRRFYSITGHGQKVARQALTELGVPAAGVARDNQVFSGHEATMRGTRESRCCSSKPRVRRPLVGR